MYLLWCTGVTVHIYFVHIDECRDLIRWRHPTRCDKVGEFKEESKEGSQTNVKAEENEELLIVHANAIVDPWTMMIHFDYLT